MLNLTNQYNSKKRALESLRVQMTTIQTARPNEAFMYNGVDLVNDIRFSGRNSIKWGLKVIDFMFTKSELQASVLEPSNRTERTTLDPERVQILKGKYIV